MNGLTDLQQSAWDIIKQARIGKEITGKQVAQSIGLKPRSPDKEGADMRQVIHALRVKEYPLCANTGGYYAAKDKQELLDYCKSLEGRIRETQMALNGLEKANPVFELEAQEGVWNL